MTICYTTDCIHSKGHSCELAGESMIGCNGCCYNYHREGDDIVTYDKDGNILYSTKYKCL